MASKSRSTGQVIKLMGRHRIFLWGVFFPTCDYVDRAGNRLPVDSMGNPVGNGDGFSRYKEDWSDAEVAKEANKRSNFPDMVFNEHHVSGIRREVYGNFLNRSLGTRGPAGGASVDALAHRVTDLEDTLRKWESWGARIKGSHDALSGRIKRLETWAQLRPVGAFPEDPEAEIVAAPGARGK